MLKRVVITNYHGESMEYRIDGVQTENPSGLIITDISGLGPTKANINITELTTTDGGIYNSARLSTRNIVIKALFTHTSDIEEARLLSYKYFPIKKKVKVRVETTNRVAETEGYVESNEPDIFSDKSACQISILCESAFFTAGDNDAEQIIRFSSTEKLFAFPFQGEIVEGVKSIKMGEFVSRRDSIITYRGDSENGITLKIHASGEATNITVYDVDTEQSIKINTDKLPQVPGLSGAEPKLIAGDEVVICSLTGQKSIYLYREGIGYNILNLLDKNSDWFTIAKGDNRFVYEAETGEEHLDIVIVAGVIYEGV